MFIHFEPAPVFFFTYFFFILFATYITPTYWYLFDCSKSTTNRQCNYFIRIETTETVRLILPFFFRLAFVDFIFLFRSRFLDKYKKNKNTESFWFAKRTTTTDKVKNAISLYRERNNNIIVITIIIDLRTE